MTCVVDSSVWIDYFGGGPRAEEFAEIIHKPAELIVPTLVLFEVYKKIKNELGEEEALWAASQIEQSMIAPLSSSIAYLAADFSINHHLAMADAIIYATAVSYGAKLYTGDADFKNLPDVTYFPPLE